jgi:hypothetical protein
MTMENVQDGVVAVPDSAGVLFARGLTSWGSKVAAPVGGYRINARIDNYYYWWSLLRPAENYD